MRECIERSECKIPCIPGFEPSNCESFREILTKRNSRPPQEFTSDRLIIAAANTREDTRELYPSTSW